MVTGTRTGDELLTTAEAARYLGFQQDTVRRYIYRGMIRSQKIGNMHVVRRSECDRYRNERRSPGRPSEK